MLYIAFAIATILSVFITSPVSAQVVITQARALAGNVTPGDTAGFPITLSQPGSYVLGSNLSVPANKYGIYVSAPEVSIDLAGFTMFGSRTATYGIVGSSRSLTILNGTIRDFVNDGIFALGPLFRVENMRIASNRRYGINGIYVNSNPKTGREDGQSIIRNNIIFGNSQGITCQSSCHVDGNVITHNDYSAIIISQSGASVTNNDISNNGGYGVVGNYIGLSNNTIYNNTYCHTSGVMMVGTRNMIFPTTSGTYCTALPGN